MSFARRYIDDGTAVFPDEASAHAFIDAYGKLDPHVKITSDISATEFVMVDTSASKGLDWELTGNLDLALYQKPDSAFLYIPAFSDHPEHVLKAFIRSECMRIVKRNSAELRFLQHRELFRFRLLARCYSRKFIGEAFSTVTYADRHKFLYERHLAAKEKDSTATDENIAPALIALSLPHSQRADALGITQAIFSARSEYLTGVNTMPEVLRAATFLHARKSGMKLGSLLLDYRYPRL
jgi:hypothetical protein